MKRTKFSFIVSFLLLLLITVMALPGCGSNEGNNSNEETQEVGGIRDEGAEDSTSTTPQVGEGENSFLFEVITEEEESFFWMVHTDETMVGDALLEHDLVQGDMTDFGLFVTEINGIVADFDDGGAFWAFYIDGDFAMTGVMETEIEPDTTYAFVFSR
jgi:hypothetical protein